MVAHHLYLLLNVQQVARKARGVYEHITCVSLPTPIQKKQGHVPCRGEKKAKILTFGLSNQITIKKNTPLTVATKIGFRRT